MQLAGKGQVRAIGFCVSCGFTRMAGDVACFACGDEAKPFIMPEHELDSGVLTLPFGLSASGLDTAEGRLLFLSDEGQATCKLCIATCCANARTDKEDETMNVDALTTEELATLESLLMKAGVETDFGGELPMRELGAEYSETRGDVTVTVRVPIDAELAERAGEDRSAMACVYRCAVAHILACCVRLDGNYSPMLSTARPARAI